MEANFYLSFYSFIHLFFILWGRGRSVKFTSELILMTRASKNSEGRQVLHLKVKNYVA